jgi:hypothetical protein
MALSSSGLFQYSIKCPLMMDSTIDQQKSIILANLPIITGNGFNITSTILNAKEIDGDSLYVYVQLNWSLSNGITLNTLPLDKGLSFGKYMHDTLDNPGDFQYNANVITIHTFGNIPLATSLETPEGTFGQFQGIGELIILSSAGAPYIRNISMAHAFNGLQKFNSPISTWDMSLVTNTDFMFSNCLSFNQPLTNWNLRSVVSMIGMFENAETFNQNLSSVKINPNIQTLHNLFSGAINFNNGAAQGNTTTPLGVNWNVNNYVPFTFCGSGCPLTKQNAYPLIPKEYVQTFIYSYVAPMDIFIYPDERNDYFSSLGLNFPLPINPKSSVIYLEEPIITPLNDNSGRTLVKVNWRTYSTPSLMKNVLLSGLNFSNPMIAATAMPVDTDGNFLNPDGSIVLNDEGSPVMVTPDDIQYLQYYSNANVFIHQFGDIPLSTTFMDPQAPVGIFQCLNTITFLNNSGTPTIQDGTDLSYLFYGVYINGSINNWNVSNVSKMGLAFCNANYIGQLSSWNVSKVTDMAGMFAGSNFNGSLTSWNLSGNTNISQMFKGNKLFNNGGSESDTSNPLGAGWLSVATYANTLLSDDKPFADTNITKENAYPIKLTNATIQPIITTITAANISQPYSLKKINLLNIVSTNHPTSINPLNFSVPKNAYFSVTQAGIVTFTKSGGSATITVTQNSDYLYTAATKTFVLTITAKSVQPTQKRIKKNTKK